MPSVLRHRPPSSPLWGWHGLLLQARQDADAPHKDGRLSAALCVKVQRWWSAFRCMRLGLAGVVGPAEILLSTGSPRARSLHGSWTNAARRGARSRAASLRRARSPTSSASRRQQRRFRACQSSSRPGLEPLPDAPEGVDALAAPPREPGVSSHGAQMVGARRLAFCEESKAFGSELFRAGLHERARRRYKKAMLDARCRSNGPRAECHTQRARAAVPPEHCRLRPQGGHGQRGRAPRSAPRHEGPRDRPESVCAPSGELRHVSMRRRR